MSGFKVRVWSFRKIGWAGSYKNFSIAWTLNKRVRTSKINRWSSLIWELWVGKSHSQVIVQTFHFLKPVSNPSNWKLIFELFSLDVENLLSLIAPKSLIDNLYWLVIFPGLATSRVENNSEIIKNSDNIICVLSIAILYTYLLILQNKGQNCHMLIKK